MPPSGQPECCDANEPLPARPPGTGQNGFGLNWGNGFVTDPEIIRNRGLSDATPFFTELITKPYVDKVWPGRGWLHRMRALACAGIHTPVPDATLAPRAPAKHAAPLPTQVVITPHVYPPTITHGTFLGETLWDQCRTAFGYLQEKGFCTASGTCKASSFAGAA